ncbi:HpcH/HpaI aldolase/citrate lyase family protein [Parafrankia sp. FMc2]|uniref:HpcH/HpaI aldolase/citrate lyase family protein n=1 Tax=Parafrankia sp. FMc2 TaxID=3233196 RepID=UPI0034D480D6
MNASRSCLCVPGMNERMIEKALASAADEIVLDLEDAVPPDGKDAARSVVTATLAASPSGAASARSLSIRVNAVRTAWCHEDVVACASVDGPARPLVIPKVESAGDLAFIDRLLDGVEARVGRREPTTIQALIETPRGLSNLREIVAVTPRLRAVIIGYADLGASLGRPAAGASMTWLAAQHDVLVAARGVGLAAIDGPYLGVDVGDDFTASTDHAARTGFDGKWVIHPRQIEAVNAAFTPSSDQVSKARRIVAVLDEAHALGLGAVSLDGQMIDEALAVAARRTLARVPADAG